jgi:hypothetical protein
MRLLKLSDIPVTERDLVFHHSPARALGAAVAVACASAGLVLLGWHDSGIFYCAAGLLVLGQVLFRRLVLARFRPSNWLVRMTADGLFIQFRSYLNYHFPVGDLTVVFLPHREIRSAVLVRQRRDIPGRDERGRRATVSERIRRLVRLELAGDPAPLRAALASESARKAPTERRWYGTASTRYKHCPVRMASPTLLELEWEVVPGPEILLDGLGPHAEVATPLEETGDFASLRGLSREDQERRLLDLAETGQTVAAVGLARELFALDLAEAQAFVAGLRYGDGGNAPPPARTSASAPRGPAGPRSVHPS